MEVGAVVSVKLPVVSVPTAVSEAEDKDEIEASGQVGRLQASTEQQPENPLALQT